MERTFSGIPKRMGAQEINGGHANPLDADLAQVLGYLNFSSGNMDSRTLGALNRLYKQALPGGPFEGMPAWLQIQMWLQEALARLQVENPAFQDTSQAERLLELVWLHLLPDYLDYHRDLLFHQEPEGIFNGFFLGKAMEAVVLQGPDWGDPAAVALRAIQHLNDFVGYRPVAVLEGRKLQPYPHEWVRPIPVFLRHVGVAEGMYHDILSTALEILRQTPPDICRRAGFDLEVVDEIGIDPRAFDFDHPVNQRPNYQFGQWDPHTIDNSGRYRRFIIQQVTIDALLARIDERHDLPREELILEAAAVLAGTMLMASGITGWGPGAYPSTVSLADLMKPIAEYRDEFYEWLIETVPAPHRDRLLAEQRIRKQPFGGARQHLNTHLARNRASQLEHVQLARLFARMGHATASKEQSDFVQAPSARIVSRIDCLMTAAHQMLERGELRDAAALSPQIIDLLHRGIECGAIVDPWNILGFGGSFPRSEGADGAVHDHRVEDLVHLMEALFALQSRIWREAAAAGDEELCQTIDQELRRTAEWWRQFAAHEVSDVKATDPLETMDSALLVAKALRLWHAGGAAVGDVRFWAPHAQLFDSPKAYALVVESLLERNDFVASMALLVHWLSQVERVGLHKGEASFPRLALRWLQQLDTYLRAHPACDQVHWGLALKFFDYLEANAGPYLEPPEFLLGKPQRSVTDASADDFLLEETDDADGLFDAAYEDVVYQDTADDGIDGELSPEFSPVESNELTEEANRLIDHLSFLASMAEMWKTAALSPHLRTALIDQSTPPAASRPTTSADPTAYDVGGQERVIAAMQSWAAQAAHHRRALLQLMQQVAEYRIPKTSADHEAMSQYDRQRLIKDSLLEKIIDTAVETADARRLLLANLLTLQSTGEAVAEEIKTLGEDDRIAIMIVGDLLSGRTDRIADTFPRLLSALRPKKLLYIPLVRGGDAGMIYSVRLRRRILSHLLRWLPRQGFIQEACMLIETARFMEHHNPIGPGAVTEFDELFYLCFHSIVQSIVQNAATWKLTRLRSASNSSTSNNPSATGRNAGDDQQRPSPGANDAGLPLPPAIDVEAGDGEALGDLEPDSHELIDLLEQLNEVMLMSWLAHSRTLRLSVLESLEGAPAWERLVTFIQRFGGPLFTQSFLRLGNVRAILHQGVGHWLDQVAEEGRTEEVDMLLDAIDAGQIRRSEAEQMLSIVLEAVIDHYAEYRDYNSTTTQSDRGEYFYMFLDFLRLRVRYDRVCWNLKPIYWTHDVLVRSGCHQNAQHWRRALAERIGRESEYYIERLQELQAKYAMRMPTVADRLHERFTRPMTVDRICALVGPAMRQLSEQGHSETFDLLIEECKLMMEQPTGVGLEIPDWLAALEDEVDRVLEKQRGFFTRPQDERAVGFRQLSAQQIADQLDAAMRFFKSSRPTSS
ncbi:MAG: hypothetical protein KatS3mg111_3013 [Pirellulaceae bacterium]|nr:MAG: hypothetical protein KatS3mg111_3013 [Pirellulaceae bacterium]